MTWTWHDISFEFIWRFGRWNYMTLYTLKMRHSFTGKKREDVRWISAFRVCFMDVGIEPWTYPSKFGWPNSGPDFIQQVLLPSLEPARPSKWTCPRWKLKSSCPAMKIWWCTSDPIGENRCRKCPAGPWSTVLVAKCLRSWRNTKIWWSNLPSACILAWEFSTLGALMIPASFAFQFLL